MCAKHQLLHSTKVTRSIRWNNVKRNTNRLNWTANIFENEENVWTENDEFSFFPLVMWRMIIVLMEIELNFPNEDASNVWKLWFTGRKIHHVLKMDSMKKCKDYWSQKWRWKSIQKWIHCKKYAHLLNKFENLNIWLLLPVGKMVKSVQCGARAVKWLLCLNINIQHSTFNRNIQNSKKSENWKLWHLFSHFGPIFNCFILNFVVFLFSFSVVLLVSTSVFGNAHLVWPRFRWMAYFVE